MFNICLNFLPCSASPGMPKASGEHNASAQTLCRFPRGSFRNSRFLVSGHLKSTMPCIDLSSGACFWRLLLSTQRVVKCFSWLVMKSGREAHFGSCLVRADVEPLGWRAPTVCLGTLNRHCRTSLPAAGEILSRLLTFNGAIESISGVIFSPPFLCS